MIRDIWNRTRDGKDSGSFRVLNIEVAGIGPAREITRQDVFNQNIKSLDHTVEILKLFFTLSCVFCVHDGYVCIGEIPLFNDWQT